MKIACRLIGAVPPLILATFVRKLALSTYSLSLSLSHSHHLTLLSSSVINITGLSGFFIGYIIPGLMQWAARRYCVLRWGEDGKHTPYSTHFSHPVYAFGVIIFAVLSFLFSILELIFGSKYNF